MASKIPLKMSKWDKNILVNFQELYDYSPTDDIFRIFLRIIRNYEILTSGRFASHFVNMLFLVPNSIELSMKNIRKSRTNLRMLISARYFPPRYLLPINLNWWATGRLASHFFIQICFLVLFGISISVDFCSIYSSTYYLPIEGTEISYFHSNI